MLVCEKRLVINTEFGGFSLCDKMVGWLMAQKHWRASQYAEDHVEIWQGGSSYFTVNPKREMELRSSDALIECVEHFHRLNKEKNFLQRTGTPAADLAIATVRVMLSVCDYHDGKERVEAECCVTTDSYSEQLPAESDTPQCRAEKRQSP